MSSGCIAGRSDAREVETGLFGGALDHGIDVIHSYFVTCPNRFLAKDDSRRSCHPRLTAPLSRRYAFGMHSKRFCIALLVALLFGSLSILAQQAATSPVVIKVTDPTGAGVAHAPVRIVPSPTSTKLETDDKGKISLALKPGGYALFVRASGFKVSSTHFDVNEAKEEQLIPVLLQIGANSGPIMVVPASSRSGLAVYAFPYHNPVVISLAELSAMAQTTVTIHNSAHQCG